MVLGKKSQQDAAVAMAKEQEKGEEQAPPPSSALNDALSDVPSSPFSGDANDPHGHLARAKASADEKLARLAIPKPTRGRIVEYTNAEGVTFPAIVVDVDLTQPFHVGLFVFTPKGSTNADAVPYSDADHTDVARFNSWKWPARV